jgi:hypothetical protein
VKLITADAIPVNVQAMAYTPKAKSRPFFAVKIPIRPVTTIPTAIADKGRKLGIGEQHERRLLLDFLPKSSLGPIDHGVLGSF